MSRRFLRLAAFGLVMTTCAGCAFMDPYERVGMWRPRGSNEGNLAAMVADPHDLQVGKSSPTTDALLAAAAVDRLRHDKVKALPSTTFGVSGGGAGAASGGGSGATDGIN